MNPSVETLVRMPLAQGHIEGMLAIPAHAHGLVLFAHGSGSSRHSPRNNYVAGVLREHGLGTLLLDLLTPEEDAVRETRFDIDLLTRRLLLATHWLDADARDAGVDVPQVPLGYFGASTGAAAALQAAAQLGRGIGAVVSRGGRPDLAGSAALRQVTAPTLLLVGGRDDVVIELNREAYAQLACEKELIIVPGATHLFEEPGTLEEVARQAAAWLRRHLA